MQLGQHWRAAPDSSVGGLPQTDRHRAKFRELAYRLAGGAPAEPWWREPHGRILALARARTWPARLVDVETQTCQLVGDEFYDRLQSPRTGLHPAQWLRALAEETGAALGAAPAEVPEDWPKLWALLCGLALTAPRTPANPAHDTVREMLPEFPDIKDPGKPRPRTHVPSDPGPGLRYLLVGNGHMRVSRSGSRASRAPRRTRA